MFPYALLTFAPNTDAELGNGVAASLPLLEDGWHLSKHFCLSAIRCTSLPRGVPQLLQLWQLVAPLLTTSIQNKLPENTNFQRFWKGRHYFLIIYHSCPWLSRNVQPGACKTHAFSQVTSPKLYSIPPSHIMHICSLAQGTFWNLLSVIARQDSKLSLPLDLFHIQKTLGICTAFLRRLFWINSIPLISKSVLLTCTALLKTIHRTEPDWSKHSQM